jgi:hypothetical protein
MKVMIDQVIKKFPHRAMHDAQAPPDEPLKAVSTAWFICYDYWYDQPRISNPRLRDMRRNLHLPRKGCMYIKADVTGLIPKIALRIPFCLPCVLFRTLAGIKDPERLIFERLHHFLRLEVALDGVIGHAPGYTLLTWKSCR